MKKIILSILAAALMTPAAIAQVNNCDVNYDNKVNTADVVAVYANIIDGTVPQKPKMKEMSFRVDDVVFYMEPVEGGSFLMGATAEQESPKNDETPAHQVTLSDYYMGALEVTQELWEAVMGEANNPSYNQGLKLPVEKVSYSECLKFINKLNTRFESELNGMKFRLPTEAEWEFAARGGNKAKHWQYCGEYKDLKTLNDYAWYKENSPNQTQYCGEKYVNELGLYDMSGNVSEWCSDWYGEYSSEAQVNPTGPSTGSYHVIRGGNMATEASLCRASARQSVDAGQHWTVGFRLALSYEPTTFAPTVQINSADVNYDHKVNTADVVAVYNNIINGELPEKKVEPNLNIPFDYKGVSMFIPMVFVEGGTFMMGATTEQNSTQNKELPVHEVTLSDYYIEYSELPQVTWETFMGADHNPSNNKGLFYPVENVSYNKIKEFIDILNTQLAGELKGMKFRLPTEAEWEFAARGGNKSMHYTYSGSNTPDEVVWCYDNSEFSSHPIVGKKANELGLYDMSGNVWEWCSDRYGYYDSKPQTNPTGSPVGKERVIRGGGYSGDPYNISHRDNKKPDDSSINLGFRLVLSY